MSAKKRHGFTLVELLVVIAIIGILIALLLPAIQAAREAARRMSCLNNMAQLGLAVRNYESGYGTLPPGVTNPEGPIRNEPKGNHIGWIVHVLPYIEEETTFKNIDLEAGAYDEKNAAVRTISISSFTCPSSRWGWGWGEDDPLGPSNYAGCHHDVEAPIDADNHGVFFLNSRISAEDITDGTTHTIFIGEKLGETDLGWMSGTRATLRNTGTPINKTEPVEGPFEEIFGEERDAEETVDEETVAEETDGQGPLYVGGFGSDHTGGANFLFGDGAVRFVANGIEQSVYQQLGHRADGQLLMTGPTRDE